MHKTDRSDCSIVVVRAELAKALVSIDSMVLNP